MEAILAIGIFVGAAWIISLFGKKAAKNKGSYQYYSNDSNYDLASSDGWSDYCGGESGGSDGGGGGCD